MIVTTRPLIVAVKGTTAPSFKVKKGVTFSLVPKEVPPILKIFRQILE